MQAPSEIRVCMDIGSRRLRVGIGLSNGEFDLPWPRSYLQLRQGFLKTGLT